MAKRSTRGVPENLRALAEQGERIRFNGFWLGESDRDRVIAQWIDDTPGAGSVIKAILYAAITGSGLAVGSVSQDAFSDEIEIGDQARALADFDD
jgi:hypothetical protein